MSTKMTAYGSITIVDVTDIGEFSIYPMSNSPLSVVYDPNQSTYTPNWGTNNLVLQPMIYYAGRKLDSSTSGLTVVWKRKDGVGAESNLGDNETVSNHNLTVSANKLGTSPSGILTYICTATYVEPESLTTLTATGQITFSLIKNASNVKKCTIAGENVFKYNTNGVLVGAEYITLTATANNVSISKWQYKNSSGVWTDYPVTSGRNSSNTGETLKVYAAENVFVNDVANIRVTTTDSTVFDICTVAKLRDGAAGAGTVTAVLSNDDQWIACNSSETPLTGAFANAVSTITILEGGEDVTSSWKITCTPTGATGSYDSSKYTYTVTGISQQSANIEFKCEKTGYATIYKNFSLTKLIAAKDGETPVIYTVSPDVLATNRAIDGTYTPASVTFTAYSKTGNEDRKAYSGRFKIFENNNTAASYTSQSNESSKTYTFSGPTLNSVRCELYAAGGTTTLLDKQTVVVTSDGATGATGQTGAKGDSAINVVLGNQADIIPCDKDGKVKSAMTLTIPFTGYVGTAKEACTVAVSGLPTGITTKTNTAGTSSAGGTLVLSVAAGSTLGDKDSGSITLTFTCKGSTVLHYYQWSKSIQAANGDNAILFEIYAPNGNVIVNGENNVTLSARLMDGATEATSSASYVWKKYSGGYQTVSGATSSSLVVQPADVSGHVSYQCVATYKEKEYTAYYAVIDKSDPVQAQVYCSIGTQILNGQGYGAVYTKLTRNGEEIDALKSERFLTEAPTSASKGDYYYHLDTGNKTVTLMKHNGSKWEAAPTTDLPTKTYNYTFYDKNGEETKYNGASTVTGKVFYIDGSLISKKVIINVEVTV